jgi:pyrroloquinoline-quinone synthase
MIHYDLHEEIDVKHSQDFFDVLAPAWEKSAENRYYIEQGLRLGAHVFNGLYEGLYRARKRRLMRRLRGPHSRAAGIA